MDAVSELKETAHDREAWDSAALRLEDFLRAHRIRSRERLLRLTVEILDAARLAHQSAPASSPMAVTMDLATKRADRWFSLLIDPDGGPDSATRGKVAYFASGIHRRWPEAFLDPHPPEALLEAVRKSSVQAGPALEFSSLIRKEVDYGPMEDLARETWGQFSWAHVLRAFVLWVAIFFASYGVWLRFFS
jgi:hypothetical protein